MPKKYFPIVSYAVQSKGPVLSGLMLDNGPALVMPYFIEAGYTPVFFDFNNISTVEKIAKNGKESFLKSSINELDDFVKRTSSRIITFKVYANGVRDTICIAEQLKERNKDLIIAGTGPHVAIFREEIFNFTDAFDILHVGDGEVSAVPLADFAYKNAPLKDVPNIIYMDKGNIIKTKRQFVDLNELRFPVYDKEFYPSVDDKFFIPVVVDSKGCFGECTFCNHHQNASEKYRIRNAELVVGEKEHNYKKYGATVSRLSGNPSPSYINRLVNLLDEKYKISAFGCISDKYNFSGISKNIIGLFSGLESTDERILKEVYKKTNDAEKYLANAKIMAREMLKNRIPTIFSMIVPSPFETDRSIEKNLEFLIRANPDFAPTLPIGLFPNTSLTIKAMEEGKDSGILLDKDFLQKWFFFELDLLKKPEEQPVQPYEVAVNNRLTRNVFGVTQKFLAPLAEHNIRPLADEIILMAYLFYDGLSRKQEERRNQGNEFMAYARKSIAEDYKSLRKIKDVINGNQGVGN